MPDVIARGHVKFTAEDPTEYCKKRNNDMMQVVGYALDMITKGVLPKV